MDEKILGVGYLRVSSKPQTDGASLDIQQESVNRLLQQNNCTELVIFNEGGKSGKLIEERDEFIDALEYALEHNAKYFAVYDTSRFARNADRAIALFKQLVQQGTVFLCANGKFEDTPEGKLMFSLFAVIDEYQSNKSGEKIKDSKKKAREMGLFLGVAPSGYLNIRQNNRGAIIVDPENGPILQEALLKFASGELLTQLEMADLLTDKGFTYKRLKQGRPISKQYVSKLLHNPQYCGYNKYEKGELLVPHPYECLITVETFLKIQNRLSKNSQANIKQKKFREELPLRQFLVCEQCGNNMYGYEHSNDKGDKYFRYACKTKGCVPSTQAEGLNAKFKAAMSQMEMSEGKINLLQSVLLRSLNKQNKTIKTKQEKKQKEISELEEVIKQKYAVLERINHPQIMSRFETEILKLEGQVRDKQNEYNKLSVPENYEPLVKKTLPKLRNPLYVWQKASPKTKASFQRWLFPSGITYTKKQDLRTTETCLTYSVLDSLDSTSPVNC